MKDRDYNDLDKLLISVEEVFGRAPQSPTDFIQLADEIKLKGCGSIGRTTLKRIWGYVTNAHSPTYNTLSVLARYAGYRDWEAFIYYKRNETESGFSPEGFVTVEEEKPGNRFLVEWAGEKWIEIEKSENPDLFMVRDSGNIKLKRGDSIKLTALAIGEKFIATGCVRDGRLLGTYVGAREDGIRKITRV